MENSLAMQKVITPLAQKHGLDLALPSAHLRLEMKGYDRLVIEKIAPKLISVAHYFEQHGILIADPEMVFYTGQAEWVPLGIQQVIGGYRAVAELHSEQDQLTLVDEAGQFQLAEFARMWVSNIKNQGWLQQARKGALVVPNTERRFGLGRLLTTPGAQAALTSAGQKSFEFFARHQAGDWGDLCEEDKQLNDDSVNTHGRIFSAYHLNSGVKVWVITEADRRATTILLPDEY
jgi:hypothetical protein